MAWGAGRAKAFGSKKTTMYGRTFDSKLETALFEFLSARERVGEFRDLQHQPGTVFLSDARIQYRPDFRLVRCETGETEWAEAKGFETPEWRIKRKLWMAYGPGKLWIYNGSHKKLFLKEVLEPEQK